MYRNNYYVGIVSCYMVMGGKEASFNEFDLENETRRKMNQEAYFGDW